MPLRSLVDLPASYDFVQQVDTIVREFLQGQKQISFPAEAYQANAVSHPDHQQQYEGFIRSAQALTSLKEQLSQLEPTMRTMIQTTRQSLFLCHRSPTKEHTLRAGKLFHQLKQMHRETKLSGTFEDFLAGRNGHHWEDFLALKWMVIEYPINQAIRHYIDELVSISPEKQRQDDPAALRAALLRVLEPSIQTYKQKMFTVCREQTENERNQVLASHQVLASQNQSIKVGKMRVSNIVNPQQMDDQQWMDSSFKSHRLRLNPPPRQARVLVTGQASVLAQDFRIPGPAAVRICTASELFDRRVAIFAERSRSGLKRRTSVTTTYLPPVETQTTAQASTDGLKETAELTELLRLVELVKAMLTAGETDAQGLPVGSLCLGLPRSSDIDDRHTNSLIDIVAIFEMVREQNKIPQTFALTTDLAAEMQLAGQDIKARVDEIKKIMTGSHLNLTDVLSLDVKISAQNIDEVRQKQMEIAEEQQRRISLGAGSSEEGKGADDESSSFSPGC